MRHWKSYLGLVIGVVAAAVFINASLSRHAVSHGGTPDALADDSGRLKRRVELLEARLNILEQRQEDAVLSEARHGTEADIDGVAVLRSAADEMADGRVTAHDSAAQETASTANESDETDRLPDLPAVDADLSELPYTGPEPTGPEVAAFLELRQWMRGHIKMVDESGVAFGIDEVRDRIASALLHPKLEAKVYGELNAYLLTGRRF